MINMSAQGRNCYAIHPEIVHSNGQTIHEEYISFTANICVCNALIHPNPFTIINSNWWLRWICCNRIFEVHLHCLPPSMAYKKLLTYATYLDFINMALKCVEVFTIHLNNIVQDIPCNVVMFNACFLLFACSSECMLLSSLKTFRLNPVGTRISRNISDKNW